MCIAFQAVQRGDIECPICLGALGSHSYVDQRTSQPKNQTVQDIYHSLSTSGTKDTSPAAKTHDRNKGRKGSDSTKDPLAKGDSKSKSRKTVLLSCSHVFHDVCLQTFEELALTEGRPQCPVCRSLYQKKVIAY